MGQGANVFFNVVSIIFFVLTLVVGVVVISVATGTIESPVFAPEATSIPATEFSPPTLTPSLPPGVTPTDVPAETPEAPGGEDAPADEAPESGAE